MPHLSPETWALGIHDAHCHPTDTPSSIPLIPSMKATTLTIMSTRAHDQERVAEAADRYGVDLPAEKEGRGRVVPSFGWHPWFSHLLFDDTPGLDQEDIFYFYSFAPPPSSSSSSSITPTPTPTPTPSAEEISHAKNLLQLHRTSQTRQLKLTHYPHILTGGESISEEFILALPAPTPLSEFLRQTKTYLEKFPSAIVGEVGLDRSFRLPWPEGYTPPSETAPPPQKEPNSSSNATPLAHRHLSPHRVHLPHQKSVLTAQLRLAGLLSRPASLHGVQAHGALFDTLSLLWQHHLIPTESHRARKNRLKREQKLKLTPEEIRWLRRHETSSSTPNSQAAPKNPFPPRICLHSFSAPLQTLTQYLSPPKSDPNNPIPMRIPSEVFFSFSTTINSSHTSKIKETIPRVPDDRILVESDLHKAGKEMDGYLEEAVGLVCEGKGWRVEEGVRRLAGNWGRWVFGAGAGGEGSVGEDSEQEEEEDERDEGIEEDEELKIVMEKFRGGGANSSSSGRTAEALPNVNSGNEGRTSRIPRASPSESEIQPRSSTETEHANSIMAL